jgi:NAD-dependent protein deacetylase/lipoamidase
MEPVQREDAQRAGQQSAPVRAAGPAAGEPPVWARGVRAVAVLTGAGISTDSGIPDFRGPQGLWTRNPGAEKLSTYDAYVSDPVLRRRSWQARRQHPAWHAQPNPAHLAVTRLATSGIDTSVITQNIDGLHQKAGTPADRVIELHGTMFSVVCVSCGERTPMTDALARVEAGEDDPPCRRCGGILKSATVMFGQPLDPADFARAHRAATTCDLFLAVGSTLSVEPAASLCLRARLAGAALVIVNAGPTPYDELATEVIRDPIGEAVPRIASHLLVGEAGVRDRRQGPLSGL